nr:dimethylamine monooxygenase subunit DmmA family protein [Hyphomicrobium denitrificans]
MIEPGIKSRPTYERLKPDPFAKSNIVVIDAGGSDAYLDMAKSASEQFLARTTVLLDRESASEASVASKVTSTKVGNLWIFPTLETLIGRLDSVLANSKMGTRLYAAGREPLIGSVVKTAIAHGVSHNSVITEHRGSLTRRVQCVHCKGYTDNVTTNPVRCAHCGLTLLVRDHYSRRIGAFQGVCIDAEKPGEVPETKVEFA